MCVGCAQYLLYVFYHNVLDFSDATTDPVDGVCIWVICKVAHALLQHAAEFCVELICNGILGGFWAIRTKELVFDVI